MKAFVLESPEALRSHLAKTREVYEPQVSESGAVHWLPAGDRPFDPSLPLAQYSPKQFFFAERETLFRFDGKEFLETLPDPKPRVLFGVRACDLTAIAYQDKFFETDPYYRARREKTLLVGHDCAAPCNGGFCPTVDAGPAVREGTADLALHARSKSGESDWIVVTLSEAGERALAGLSLAAAPADWTEKRDARAGEVAAQFPDADYITKGVKMLNEGKVRGETWESLGLQCFVCSGCTTLCPTCSCFATFDHPTDKGGDPARGFTRERCWDSCLYEGFQREASGHNPAATPGQRVERYWYHKFSDDFVPEFGRYGCVGCGRCEDTCLGVIGVHSVMKRIASQQ